MKKKDPTSHRIIEKRRRDRMNNCLADLSKLIPPHYMKKGRGRVQKTEIIEMAIRHLKDLIELSSGASHQRVASNEEARQSTSGHERVGQLQQNSQQDINRPPSPTSTSSMNFASSSSSSSPSSSSTSSLSSSSSSSSSSSTAWSKKAWLVRSFSGSPPHR